MYISIYMYFPTCVYIYIYVCTHTHLYIHTYVCIVGSVYKFTNKYICIYANIYHTYVHLHMCMYVHMQIYIVYMHAYGQLRTRTQIRVPRYPWFPMDSSAASPAASNGLVAPMYSMLFMPGVGGKRLSHGRVRSQLAGPKKGTEGVAMRRFRPKDFKMPNCSGVDGYLHRCHRYILLLTSLASNHTDSPLV